MAASAETKVELVCAIGGDGTIHEVADEYCGPARMPPRAAPMPVAELGQQGLKLVGMAVDVADNVVVHALRLQGQC